MIRTRLLALLFAAALIVGPASAAHAQNPIVTENALPGNPSSEWDIAGAGDAEIQGFATQMSVAPGETVRFKVHSATAQAFHIAIYRIGWYDGDGARLIDTIPSGSTVAVAQPAPFNDAATGLIDCANWSESASWTVPAAAVSGVYVAKLVRDLDLKSSHVLFVVRDDARGAKLLLMTSDATWQAYNQSGGQSPFGGNSLYTGSPAGRAYKVSYNRPFTTRGSNSEDSFFNAEYPMVRWLERNGYDVSYCASVDLARAPAELLEHQAFLSVGHDEYWSGPMRANLEAARDAGLHLAFFSGNEVFWKTRHEASPVDAADYRTLTCYKETHAGAKIDPEAAIWTGTWRDPRPINPEGGRAENALSGTIFMVNCCAYPLQVPGEFGALRFWRNTSIAALSPESNATLPGETLGYEWDEDLDNGAQPAGLVRLSRTTVSVPQRLTDYGSTYAPGVATHHLVMHRRPSGAIVFGAGTIQWSWGLDDQHERGSNPPSPDMQQATVNLFADMGVQPATLQLGLVPATASTDATAPVAVIDAGFSGVAQIGVSGSVTGTATDVGGVVGGVEVSVDGGATWHPASGRANWSYTWVPSGPPATTTVMCRAADDSGNLQGTPASAPLSIEYPPPPDCPCTVFQPAQTPTQPALNDGQPIELGMKFRSHVAGWATGIRFYKGAANVGTHTGHLWDRNGNLLATATFTGESASGWQEVTLDTPVALTPEETYVASSYSSAGWYAFDEYFFTSGIERNPLRALADGEDGGNAVYFYGGSGFPTTTFHASNYWVDVVFNTSIGPDVTPPTIAARAPAAGATGVAAGANVVVTFSEAMNAATLDGSTLVLRDPSNAILPATVSYAAGPRQATLDPSAVLAYATTYTMTVTTGARDVAGNALAADDIWSFTSADPPPPPPGEGPGGPILVIADAANPFTRYYAEILRAEGLNAFSVVERALVNPDTLARYDVAILGECALSAAEVTMLSDWVTAGGNLIAMRPDAQLAPLLGLTVAGGSSTDRYLLIDTGSAPGTGLPGVTLQYHGGADLYTTSGAIPLATLYSDAVTPTANPAVTLRAVGGSGGQAAAFTFDLARSVVFTRQGNPAWAGQERDGVTPKRSDDLFFGAAAGDPQPDWIDLNKVAIPQADEQQRLLVRLVQHMNADRKPLPRFWYFPRGKKAVVVMTGDNHGSGGMAPRFDRYLAQSPPGCSEPDWECVRATGYLYSGPPFTDAQAAFYHALGFEVAVHVNTGCADWTPASLEANYAADLGGFAAAYPSVPAPATHRTHCIAWSDWATQAEIEVAHGIRLDTNYYYWPAGWVADRPGMFTGSGLPMRFARTDGSLIDCYQVVSQMTDESGQSFPFTINTLLDRALGAEGYYGAFCANMHFDSSPHAGSDAIVASALARDVPVVSAQQMLTWLDGRNASSFRSFAWDGGTLSFTVDAAVAARNLEAMLPASVDGNALSALTRDGSPVTWRIESVKGVDYAFFPATSGDYAATWAPDGTAPVISAVSATPHDDGTADIAWTTDEASSSRVDYGTSPGTLGSSASAAALVTAHGVTITGLSPNTTHYYRVRSTDAAANEAIEPVSAAAPLDFLTPPPVCFLDRTAADFAGGTFASTTPALAGDGEVILAAAEQQEFEGTSLPGSWTSIAWAAGGAATVGAGVLQVDAALAAPLATFAPDRAVEFSATFGGQANQHAGFGTDLNGPPWAIFSTRGGDGLYARTNSGGSSTDTPLSAALIGSPHVFRIVWRSTGVEYWVDGALAVTHPIAIAGPMRPLASDLLLAGGALEMQWMRLSPYSAGGSFTSRVYDGLTSTNWGAASWSLVSQPAGTGFSLLVRHGGTPVPDGAWTPFVAVPFSGATVGGNSRYLQYRADFTTADPLVTAVLGEVHVTCASGPDLAAPVISNVAALPDPGGTAATITWLTDEPADSRVDYGLSAALGASASDGAHVFSHSVALGGLTPGATYHFRVTSADAATNSASEPLAPGTLTFTTPAPACRVDDSAPDFGSGTRTGTMITETTDGEVTLLSPLSAEFSGASLPVDWQSAPWTGGTATVGGGALAVDGARAMATGTVSPGGAIEFVATFTPVAFQHVGFANDFDFNSPWAIFSTFNGDGNLYARTSDGTNVLVPGSWMSAPHRFRIERSGGTFDFFADGAPVASLALGVVDPLHPIASDYNTGGGGVTVDWLRASPYPASGEYESSVADAGAPATWVGAAWTATVDAATGVAIEVRAGDTPLPDASWSPFTPVAGSGGSVGLSGRYAQYRAQLSTTDPRRTPALEDLRLTCAACTDATPPPVIATLQSTTLHAPGAVAGLERVRLDWSGVEVGAAAQVYRKSYGDYPLYRDGSGATPALPATPAAALAAGWTLTGVTASGGEDLPPSRDFWHYVLFSTDACGNVSGPSNLGGGSLSYRLGDVKDGVTDCAGDGVVNTSDVSFLGASYGEALGGGDPRACMDVGPTTDYAPVSRPVPDGRLNFEDLILYAINFETGPGALSATRRVVSAGANQVTLEAGPLPAPGGTFGLALRFNGAGNLQGVSLALGWNADVVEPVGFEPGELLSRQEGPAMAFSPAPGAMDAAVLGRGSGLAGEGELGRITFRVRAAGQPGFSLRRAEGRDGSNRAQPLNGSTASSPLPSAVVRTEFRGAHPNPFTQSATIGFALERGGSVRLAVFDLGGRRVRTLVNGTLEAGERVVVWNGRDDGGAALNPGYYVLRLEAGDVVRTRTLWLLR